MVAENFSNLVRNVNLQIQEIEQTPNMIDAKQSIPRHITSKILKKNLDTKKFKNLKEKKNSWKQPREKWYIAYKGIPIWR